jgi:hypothetical protein
MWPPLSETNPVYAVLAAERNADGEPADPEAITAAWRRGEITTEELAREHVRLIEKDVAAGDVPWDVCDFPELHNFVDANTYTLDVMGMDGSGDGTDLANAVQDRVAAMLRGTLPSSLTWPGSLRLERQQAGKNRAADHRLYLQRGRQAPPAAGTRPGGPS